MFFAEAECDSPPPYVGFVFEDLVDTGSTGIVVSCRSHPRRCAVGCRAIFHTPALSGPSRGDVPETFEFRKGAKFALRALIGCASAGDRDPAILRRRRTT